IGAALHLHKAIGGQRLSERGKHSERGRSRSEPALAISRWQRHFTLRAQNGPRLYIGVERALPPDRDVSHAAEPTASGMIEAERNRHLELILLAVSFLECKLAADSGGALHVHAAGDHRLILRESLLRH